MIYTGGPRNFYFSEFRTYIWQSKSSTLSKYIKLFKKFIFLALYLIFSKFLLIVLVKVKHFFLGMLTLLWWWKLFSTKIIFLSISMGTHIHEYSAGPTIYMSPPRSQLSKGQLWRSFLFENNSIKSRMDVFFQTCQANKLFFQCLLCFYHCPYRFSPNTS